jgi:hypothetical protein
MDRGPMDPDEARAALREWWAGRDDRPANDQ